MKLIKLLINMTLLNVMLVMGLSKYLSAVPAQVNQTKEEVVATAVETPTTKPVVKVSPTRTPQATKPVERPAPATVLATPTPPPKPAGCVIKIDGVSYEITALRKSHSGGDIFTCNTDMSAIFWGRHNQKILQKMQAYRI